ncbi:hypothetical protein HMPREF1423_01431 [Helicobacter pylori GAM270ASi]|nr:hypothetical protein [Helicobacter pylori]EMH28343.1 hypothetical protein HMPREF1423_01431 [Helicobacter pylori GAM270ASi]
MRVLNGNNACVYMPITQNNDNENHVKNADIIHSFIPPARTLKN